MAARYFQLDIIPQYGGIVDGITVSVFNTGTNDYADIFTDNTLTSPKANPYVLSGYTISFWLTNASVDCDIRISGGTLGSSYFIENILTLPGPIWENQHTLWYDYPDVWAYIYPYKVIVTTTNTAEWAPDAQEIIEEAYERVGVEIRTGYQFRTARRSLNILFQEWANRGINLWTIEEGSITLLYGQGTYDLPADTVDLLEFVIRQNSGSTSNQSDIIIPRIPMPTYAAIPNKLSTGRPSQVYVNRQTPIPQINIWPTPNESGYLFHYWRMRRIYDITQPGCVVPDVPFRFVPAVIAGLAYYLSIKVPEAAERIPMLKQLYDEAFKLASDEDRDRSAVRFVPRMMRV